MKNLVGIKVKQWREEWDSVEWDESQKRGKPQPWFYQFSIPASLLRAWSGVNARVASRKRGHDDLGIQRRHEVARSNEIREYVRFGYPWSELSERRREDPDFANLRKPGWLPTAIVVNILTDKDRRNGRAVDDKDLLTIRDRADGLAELVPPQSFNGLPWDYSQLPPVEVIDGQHRLWAFDPSSKDDFDLPVVAFSGLDLSWQAYLFYTINIKPKKINPSLAFDLYPLLRTEDWLNKFEGHIVYRETRAQELVDLLYSHTSSPWYQRINMLGESGLRGRQVSQAAWVRALLATFVRAFDGPRVKLGGLYGSKIGSHSDVLPWSRLEQAAFLIYVGDALRSAVARVDDGWAKKLRGIQPNLPVADDLDAAFYGEHSLLSQDQGIRSFLHVTNDVFFLAYEELGLERALAAATYADGDELASVSVAIEQFSRSKQIAIFLSEYVSLLSEFDWRAMSAPNLTEKERLPKASFRGSGGYKELRTHLLRHLASYEGRVGEVAQSAIDQLGY